MHGSQLFLPVAITNLCGSIPFPFDCRSDATTMSIVFVTLSENCLGEPSRCAGLTKLERCLGVLWACRVDLVFNLGLPNLPPKSHYLRIVSVAGGVRNRLYL